MNFKIRVLWAVCALAGCASDIFSQDDGHKPAAGTAVLDWAARESKQREMCAPYYEKRDEILKELGKALLNLRVDADMVRTAMAGVSDGRSLRILAWVLMQRAGSAVDARRMLEKGENPNFKTAIRLLKEMKKGETAGPAIDP